MTYEQTINYLTTIAKPLPTDTRTSWRTFDGVYADMNENFRGVYYLKTEYDLVPFEVCDDGTCALLDGPYGACEHFECEDQDELFEKAYGYTHAVGAGYGLTF